MGSSHSLKDPCNCFSIFNQAVREASSLCKPKELYESSAILDEDDIHPAGLLSEAEIQRLLNESQEIHNTQIKYM
jgi:hypothetical protein